MCGSSDVPPPPPPNQTEQELNQMTLDLLKQSKSEQDALKPLLLSEAGLEETKVDNPGEQAAWRNQLVGVEKEIHDIDKAGQANHPAVTSRYQELQQQKAWLDNAIAPKYSKTAERTAAEARAKKMQEQVDVATQRQLSLYSLQADRQEKALKGELPVSEGTQQRKMQEFTRLKEQLSRSGNPVIGDTPESAYSPTTAGTQTLKSFQDHYKLVEDAERQGQISEGDTALVNSLGLTSGVGNTRESMVRGSGPSSAYSPLVGGPISLVAPTESALQPYQFNRQMSYQGSMQNAANNAAEKAGYMQLVGQIGGSAMTAAALASSRSFKKDIKPLSVKDEDRITLSLTGKRKVYRWKYKEEADNSKGHIGMVTEESPDEILTDDKKHIDIASALGVLTIGLRSMSRKIEHLERRAA